MNPALIDLRYKKLHKKAVKNGWKAPLSDLHLDLYKEAWIRYWQGCASYAADPDSGRPVIPHRSG